MKRIVSLAGLMVAVLVLPGVAAPGDAGDKVDPLKADLRKLQGKWEYTFKKDDGEVVMRKVKKIKGNTEEVTWYLPDGTVYQVNTVDFKLERQGDDHVYVYFNWKFTEGPNKGREVKGKGSFVYRLAGDTWTEVGEGGTGEFAWKRVKEKK